jgi:hypothetical protein
MRRCPSFVEQTRADQCDLGHATIYLHIDQLCSELSGESINDSCAARRDDTHRLQSILAGTNIGSVMVYHLKNLPTPTSVSVFSRRIHSSDVKTFVQESDLLSIIEQQRHHLPPPEDISSSAASAVTVKEDATPSATKH